MKYILMSMIMRAEPQNESPLQGFGHARRFILA
jgi:hypothetical protein